MNKSPLEPFLGNLPENPFHDLLLKVRSFVVRFAWLRGEMITRIIKFSPLAIGYQEKNRRQFDDLKMKEIVIYQIGSKTNYKGGHRKIICVKSSFDPSP